MSIFQDLTPLLDPRSVAIVGASEKESGWAARINVNLQRFGFSGPIYPVNPRYSAVWGQTCYPTLDDLPEIVDCAVIIVPARSVEALLLETNQKKIRSAIVASGGFGEGGDAAGLKRRSALKAFAEKWDIPICGPNCMGLVSVRQKAVLFPDLRLARLQPGGLAVVSQSGGLVGSLTRAIVTRGLGLTHYVSSGNEAVSELAQYVHYFARDPDVGLILAIVEGTKDPELLATAAAEALDARKPVVILKVGRSPKGVAAALAHTGSLAGDDRVFEAFCHSHGLVRVGDVSEMLNTAEFLQRTTCLPKGNRAAYMTFSGGLRALVADIATDAGLELPDLHEKSEQRLAPALGVGSSIGNPLDAGWAGLASQETFLLCVNTLLEDPNVDSLVIQEDLPRSDVRPDKEGNLLAVSEIAAASSKPIAMFSCLSPGVNEYGLAFKQRCNLPFLDETRAAVLATKHLAAFAESVRRREAEKGQDPQPAVSLSPQQAELLARGGALNEWKSYELLRAFGVEVATGELVSSIGEAEKFAESLGYPVVVKAIVAGVTHKTETGLVKLNLRSKAEVVNACEEMLSALSRTNMSSSLEGFLIQESVSGGVEVIVGAVDDPQFGPAVMFGVGGEFVEIYKDVVFRMAPVSDTVAFEMIASIKARALLEGFRGAPAVDKSALARTIRSVSDLVCAGSGSIDSIDINPFMCLSRGGKAVDAVVIAKTPGV